MVNVAKDGIVAAKLRPSLISRVSNGNILADVSSDLHI